MITEGNPDTYSEFHVNNLDTMLVTVDVKNF